MAFQTLNGHQLYRIGDCLISINAENPSKNFGGKWELLCPGRTLVCVDTSQSEFNTVKKTGGSKYLQSHTHNGSTGSSGGHAHTATTDSSGSHIHKLKGYEKFTSAGSTGYRPGGGGPNLAGDIIQSAGEHTHSITVESNGVHNHSVTINSAGSGNSQNLQPFMSVYIWVRVG